MADTDERSQVFNVPHPTSTEQHVAPFDQIVPDAALNPQTQHEAPRKRVLVKIAAGAALIGTIFLGGEQQAEAAPADTVSAQAPSQELESNWIIYGSLGLTALGLITSTTLSARSISRQTRENTENRFSAVLQGIKGESSGEERVLRLGDLYTYADRKTYAPKVFRAALTYLRGRRGGLEILRKEHNIGEDGEDSVGFERTITERRNADREALKLLAQTLPEVRKQLRGSSIATRLKRLVGADEHYKLGRQTGALPADSTPRVNARGLNIDYIRGVKGYSFRDTDLTGAGMQGNQFASVIFRNARLCEAQFEGSTLDGCSLRRTDARAAYWYGAKITGCVVDKHTKLGNLPDNHPDAKFGTLNPDNPGGYRGNPEVVLQGLIPYRMSEQQLIELIHEWQRNGLKLGAGSNPEYFLNPADDPNPSEPPAVA